MSENKSKSLRQMLADKWVEDGHIILPNNEELHAQQLQELKDKVVDAHRQCCTNSRCQSFGN